MKARNITARFTVSDRKKDLVKLQLGEYVSLGKVESELKTCPVVENICVYGDATKQYTVALVVPNPSNLIAMGKKLGLESLTFEQLCSNQAVEKTVLQDIAEHGKKCKCSVTILNKLGFQASDPVPFSLICVKTKKLNLWLTAPLSTRLLQLTGRWQYEGIM